MEEEVNQTEEFGESVKLIKNSKGYNWEIKLREKILTDETLSRLFDIEAKLKAKFLV